MISTALLCRQGFQLLSEPASSSVLPVPLLSQSVSRRSAPVSASLLLGDLCSRVVL